MDLLLSWENHQKMFSLHYAAKAVTFSHFQQSTYKIFIELLNLKPIRKLREITKLSTFYLLSIFENSTMDSLADIL